MVIGVTTMIVSLVTAILGLYYVNCEYSYTSETLRGKVVQVYK